VTKFALSFENPKLGQAVREWISGTLIRNVVEATGRFGSSLLEPLLDLIISVLDGGALRAVICETLLSVVPALPNYFSLCHDMLLTSVANQSYITALESAGVLLSWIELTSETILSNTRGARISAMTFLADIWLTITTTFDENDSLTSTFLELLTKECKQTARAVQLNAFTLLFRIVDTLTTARNGFAPVFYKTLIFLFVEHFTDSMLRESVEA
jgi:hypothetical protein